MAAFALLVLLLGLIGGSDAAWCVCNPNQPNPAQQKTLDYACGAGADCSPILQNGPCYNPNTVNAHCSYAANSYYQRQGQVQGSCDFSGTAMLVQSDPSSGNGCTYPPNPSAAGTSNTPATTNNPGSTTTTGSTTPPGLTTPGSTFTPNTGGTGTGTSTGVIGGGLGPSGTGTGISTDGSGAGFPPNINFGYIFVSIFLSCIVMFYSY